MRSDMAKVIVERARPGSSYQKERKGYRKQTQRLGWEDQPQRESHRHRVGGRRPFNEHLGPLRRFLRSRVGRPWSQVHAEICAHVRRDSVVQDHVRDHVDDYVATQVVLIDGVPCYGTGREYGQPLRARPWRALFYVCPKSGILKLTPKPRPARSKPPVRGILVNSGQACLLQDEIWWLVRIQPFPPPSPLIVVRVRDAALDRDLTREQAIEVYGAAVHAVGRERRLTKKEMKRLPIPIDLQRLNRRGRVISATRAAGSPGGRSRPSRSPRRR